MSIGSFILIRDESPWIGAHLASWLPYLDEMVLFDGNSKDGTLEVIRAFRDSHPDGHKITLVEDRDPKNLREDYTRLFNEALHSLKTDWAFFLHPDMLPENPEALKRVGTDGVAFYTHMRSFAGNLDGNLLEISGRGGIWKNIYRLRNPDLGAHYHGSYGAGNEDVYFSDITGDEHKPYAKPELYPYEVRDSGLRIMHFSDVRKPWRRLGRMKECLKNQGIPADMVDDIAAKHPRVTLKDGPDYVGIEYRFTPAQYPRIFTTWKDTLAVKT